MQHYVSERKHSSIPTVAWESQRIQAISKLDELGILKEEPMSLSTASWQLVQQERRYCIFSTRHFYYFVFLKYIPYFLK